MPLSKESKQVIDKLVSEGRISPHELPKGHIATNSGEIVAHGQHADLIAKTTTGSHQVRVSPDGRMSEKHNFSNESLGRRCGWENDADGRVTGMGGYNPRKY